MVNKKETLAVSESFLPKNFTELREFVDIVADSDLIPKSHRTRDGVVKKGNVMACVIMGHSLGVPPMQAIQNICVINGMPSVWGDLALALVKTHDDFVDVIEEKITDGWRCTSKRKGKADVVREFTKEDAKKAKLLGKDGPWQTYPDRMLQMRARAFSIRDQFPDALRGLKIAEEIIEVQADVVSPADKLRQKQAEKELAVQEPAQDAAPEQPTQGPDADAVSVLGVLTSRLSELGYSFSDKEKNRIGDITTDEQVAAAIDYYEKKLTHLRLNNNEVEQTGEEPPEDIELPTE